MGYQALLFCPDEKTARTLTQVLSELEFAVEACLEPFAAVKKLMAEHFDALVVDCDNEQNAALLFKSARNSTINQAALAVAVVEGQAGVAKAFRIGANLVLTKPINVEQVKGTLRVARGLLRKGEPGKPVAPVASPAPPAKPVAPAAAKPIATATPRPPAPKPAAAPPAKPAATPAMWPGQETRAAVASSAPVAHSAADDDNVIELFEEKPAPQVSRPAPAAPPSAVAQSTPKVPASPRPVAPAAPPVTPSSISFAGAAAAPAPARVPESVLLPQSMSEQTAELVTAQPASTAHSVPAPSFSFGGTNTQEESSGGNKKILIGIAAAVVVAAASYVGWTQLHGKSSAPAPTTETASQPAALSQSAQLNTAPTAKSPATANAPVTSPDISLGPEEAGPAVDEDSQVATKNSVSAGKPAKTAGTASHAAAKSAPAAEPEAEPIMVKNGSQPPVKKPAATDTAAAPSMAGIAAPSSSGSISNLIGAQPNSPKPILEAMTISQGVSQGLLIKKVSPAYPSNAMRMRIEGSVQLLATISRAGNITAVKIVSGEPMLTRAAADAVKQWKYKPYLLNGEPVEIQTQITVNFKLPR